jgi:hypothetical protein
MSMTKKINLKNFIFITSLLLALLITDANAMTSKQPKQVVIQESLLMSNNKESNQKPSETDLSQGRSFSMLSFNPDGSELMFNECFEAKMLSKDVNKNNKQNATVNERECKIFRLNLKNKTLKYYSFPNQDKYTYTNGSFSPKGNFVTFTRTPKTDPLLPPKEYNKQSLNDTKKSEIGIINSDGSNFRVIKIEEGLKIRPIMSNDETKIAYHRTRLIAPRGKIIGISFDVYEIDLKEKTDKLFAGPHQFFEIGQMQYLKGDREILVHAGVPLNDDSRGGLGTWEYNDKYLHSSINIISRDESGLLEPMTISGIIYMEHPFFTKTGTMFFYGQGTGKEKFKLAIGLFRKDKNGKIVQWARNIKDGLGLVQNEHSVLPTPDETKVFIIYTFDNGNRFRRLELSKNGIAFFDVTTSKWSKFNIPEVNSSKPISVTGFSIIKINKNTDSTNYLKELPTFTLTNPLKFK